MLQRLSRRRLHRKPCVSPNSALKPSQLPRFPRSLTPDRRLRPWDHRSHRHTSWAKGEKSEKKTVLTCAHFVDPTLALRLPLHFRTGHTARPFRAYQACHPWPEMPEQGPGRANMSKHKTHSNPRKTSERHPRPGAFSRKGPDTLLRDLRLHGHRLPWQPEPDHH